MSSGSIVVHTSGPLKGIVYASGAKNAVLVTIASLLLTSGRSKLRNVPFISDVYAMVEILRHLGAIVEINEEKNELTVDTSTLTGCTQVPQALMQKCRTSILVLGPLLARFHKASLSMPGGDAIGARPLDFHIKNLQRMGVTFEQNGDFLNAVTTDMKHARLVLDYPSVGATENIMMAAVKTAGTTTIINAAIEPEVINLIDALKKMGAQITVEAPATLVIKGVTTLYSIDHTVMVDRLEVASLLIAGAISKGDVFIPNAVSHDLDLFLSKLEEMGHTVIVGDRGIGIRVIGAEHPRIVSLKTAPYPGFPTDLQALMMVALVTAQGKSEVVETVFENRLLHVPELNKMGACIEASGHLAKIEGVERLHGAVVKATDIRAACALTLAGCIAEGTTKVIDGVHHWKRGYEMLDEKLKLLGAKMEFVDHEVDSSS